MPSTWTGSQLRYQDVFLQEPWNDLPISYISGYVIGLCFGKQKVCALDPQSYWRYIFQGNTWNHHFHILFSHSIVVYDWCISRSVLELSWSKGNLLFCHWWHTLQNRITFRVNHFNRAQFKLCAVCLLGAIFKVLLLLALSWRLILIVSIWVYWSVYN